MELGRNQARDLRIAHGGKLQLNYSAEASETAVLA
jgi:hypothetical protein